MTMSARHRWLAVASTLALLTLAACSGGTTAQSKADAGRGIQPLPAFDVADLPISPPANHPPNCSATTGTRVITWLTPYGDSGGGPLPTAVAHANAVDLFWASLDASSDGQPRLTTTSVNRRARSLHQALTDVATINPCAQRFVTIIDDATVRPDARSRGAVAKQIMASLLTDEAARRDFINQVATRIAVDPLVDGITLDLEKGIPSTKADIAALGIANSTDSLADQTQAVARRYSLLAGELRVALLRQRRQLQVVAPMRPAGSPRSSWTSPFVFDYPQLAAYSDRLILMGVDYHWQESPPGPIAPADRVVADLRRAIKLGAPLAKLGDELPVYAYDYTVTRWEADSSTEQLVPGTTTKALTHTQVIELVQTYSHTSGWNVLVTSDGTRYRYRKGSELHEVWDTTSSLRSLAAKVRALGVPTLGIWKLQINDSAGDQEVVNSMIFG